MESQSSEVEANKVSNESDMSMSTEQFDWEDCFVRLKAFQERTGHCVVDYTDPRDPQLGRWGKYTCFSFRNKHTLYPRFSHGD